MTSMKVKFSRLKWFIIETLFVFPLKFILENLYRPILVRVLQSVISTGKLDFTEKEIVMDVKTVSELSRLRSCKKEPSTVKWVLRDLRADDVFFDIGANVGAYSLVAAISSEDNTIIYSFEPSPNTFASLCRNISLNKLGAKIYPLQFALGAKTEVSKFFLSSNIAGSAEHSLGEPIDMYGNKFTPVDVQTVVSVTMDEVIDVFGVFSPTHIKIDVDGFELNVLLGAKKVLSSDRLRHLLVEVREDSIECESIVSLLRSHNFMFVRKGYATSEGFANYEFERIK
jgi:FkbM family methyltransferase